MTEKTGKYVDPWNAPISGTALLASIFLLSMILSPAVFLAMLLSGVWTAMSDVLGALALMVLIWALAGVLTYALLRGGTPRVSWPAEKAAELTCWIIALLCGPFLVMIAIGHLSLLLGPLALVVIIMMWMLINQGLLTYVILALPLMTGAWLLGWTHPLLHAAIGLLAVALHFEAYRWGLPGIVAPLKIYPGSFIFPVWSGASALFYFGLICLRAGAPQSEVA